ncbi:MAG: flavodoxin domain-containing protein [Promethearchaeati archaeon]
MGKNKTLIAYETKSGVSKDNAHLIATILREKYEMEVDIIDLKENKNPDTNGYENIIVGSGIRIGRWYKRPKSFLKKTDFGNKKLAIYLSSGKAGNPEFDHDQIVEEYVGKILNKSPQLKLVAYNAFGGCYERGGKILEDFRDPEKVKQWAEELGKLLV